MNMENKFKSPGIPLNMGSEEYYPKFNYPTNEELDECLNDKYFYKRDLDEFGCFKGTYNLNSEDILNIIDNFYQK